MSRPRCNNKEATSRELLEAQAHDKSSSLLLLLGLGRGLKRVRTQRHAFSPWARRLL